MNTLSWRILAAVSALTAGLVVGQMLDQMWERSGRDKADPSDLNVPLGAALTYAAVSGVATAASRVVATRAAAHAYARIAPAQPS